MYNVDWLLEQISKLLDFDPAEPDQAFGGTDDDPYRRIKDWLNEAYTDLINDVRLEVPKEHFEVTHQFTWPANESTYTLPDHIAMSKSLYLQDITNHEVGEELQIYNSPREGGLFWLNRTTIQHYNTTGFSVDRTLVWHYLADAEELIDGVQVPILIPFRHRYALVWSTAWKARRAVDEEAAPRFWAAEAERLKDDYKIDLSQGRLEFTAPPRLIHSYSKQNKGTIP